MTDRRGFEDDHYCPINEETADGVYVGRCCFYLKDGKTCPRHGDVSKAVDYYRQTGKLFKEALPERTKWLLWWRTRPRSR